MTTELGYYFHPAGSGTLHGYRQLDVNIFREPTEEHFDPEHLTVWAVDSRHNVGRLTIGHPHQGQKQLAICAGRISLRDRKDKIVEAFSFGSELRLTEYQTYTKAVFTSVAPFYRLVDSFQDPPSLVVSEFEVLLAKAEADWGRDGEGFKRKLAGCEPLTLFVAGLLAVRNRLRRLPARRSISRSVGAIDEEIQLLELEKGRLASFATLADLLKPVT